MNTNQTILLIGGAGYIGSYMCDFFLNKNYNIKVLDNFIYQNNFSLSSYFEHPNFELIEGDFCDSNNIKNASKNSDHIVILGGLVGDPITKRFPEISEKINFSGIKNVIDSIDSNIKKLIFISTCSNYGLINENQFADEKFILNPLSLYAKQKVNIEKYILSLKGKVNYSPVILRFATAFGLSPRMRYDLTVNEFTLLLYQGKKLSVYDENTWRPYCHIYDFSKLINQILDQPAEKVAFEIFNAGGEKNNARKKDIIEIISHFVPDLNVSYDSGSDDRRNYRVDFSKVRNVINFEPQYSIYDGVKEIVSSFSENPDDIMKIDNKNDIYGNYKLFL